MNPDSYREMLAAVQAFHDKHRFQETGGEEMVYRIALMAEEPGELSSCVTKKKVSVYLLRKSEICSYLCSERPSRRILISRSPSGIKWRSSTGAAPG